MKKVLKAKVQEIKITDCRIDYEGSLTLCPEIMNKLNVCEYEQVYINGKYKPQRIMTYLLKGKKGECVLNGGAIHFFEKGDVVHLLFFFDIPDSVNNYKPAII